MCASSLESAQVALGASFVEDMGLRLAARYGDPIEEQRFVPRSAAVFDRSYRGIVDLSGRGVEKALDAVFSSAVRRLAPGRGQLSTLLSPRGRLLAGFQLHRLTEDVFRAVFHEPPRDAALRETRKYLFLNDIAVTDRTQELGILSVEGAAAGTVLERAATGGDVPREILEARPLSLAGVEVTAVRSGETPEGGFDVWAGRASLESVWRCLIEASRAAGGGPAGHEAAEALRIEAGLARHGRDHDEENFPGDARWEGALTYDKCYVGQEVVARMRTYGQANRRLLGLYLPEGPPSFPFGGPWPLTVSGEEIGRVTSWAWSARLGRGIALAMVKRKSWEERSAAVEAPTGAGPRLAAEIAELPFVRLDAGAAAR